MPANTEYPDEAVQVLGSPEADASEQPSSFGHSNPAMPTQAMLQPELPSPVSPESAEAAGSTDVLDRGFEAMPVPEPPDRTPASDCASDASVGGSASAPTGGALETPAAVGEPGIANHGDAVLHPGPELAPSSPEAKVPPRAPLDAQPDRALHTDGIDEFAEFLLNPVATDLLLDNDFGLLPVIESQLETKGITPQEGEYSAHLFQAELMNALKATEATAPRDKGKQSVKLTFFVDQEAAKGVVQLESFHHDCFAVSKITGNLSRGSGAVSKAPAFMVEHNLLKQLVSSIPNTTTVDLVFQPKDKRLEVSMIGRCRAIPTWAVPDNWELAQLSEFVPTGELLVDKVSTAVEFLSIFAAPSIDQANLAVVEFGGGQARTGGMERLGLVKSRYLDGFNLRVRSEHMLTLRSMLSLMHGTAQVFQAGRFQIVKSGTTWAGFVKPEHSFPEVTHRFEKVAIEHVLVPRATLRNALSSHCYSLDSTVELSLTGDGPDGSMTVKTGSGREVWTDLIETVRRQPGSKGQMLVDRSVSVSVGELLALSKAADSPYMQLEFWERALKVGDELADGEIATQALLSSADPKQHESAEPDAMGPDAHQVAASEEAAESRLH